MDLSEFMNIILGGGLVGTVATIGSLRATVRKAKAEAMKAEAGAEAMRIDNAEHATRILMENIVKPLKDEFCETKKELARNTREMARLRKAIDTAGNCPHRDDCPVLDRLRESPKEHEPGIRTESASADSASGSRRAGLVMAGIPASSVKLSIPADSLRKLPEGAVYRGKSGQANLTVGSDDSGNIVAEASCDSLQQLVLWYEEELARIRSETKSEISNDVQTVEKRPPNRMRTFITGVLAGLLVGMLLTMKLKKR